MTGLDACKGGDTKIGPAAGSGSAVVPPSDGLATGGDDGGVASATCVARDDDVYIQFDKQLLVCAVEAKRCFSLDPETGATAAAAAHDEEPRRSLSQARIEMRDGKAAACFRDRCKTLGPNAKQDVDAADKDDVAGTIDLVALVVPIEGDWHIWDIARDRRIEIEPPSPEQGAGLVWPSGNELYVNWTPPDERVYSSRGAQVASLYNEGSQLVALDDTRWVALTGDRKLHVFGEPRHTIDLAESLGYADWTENLGVTVIDHGNLAVALVRSSEAVVALIDPRRGVVYKRWPLALCP